MSKRQPKSSPDLPMTIEELSVILARSFEDLHGRVGKLDQHLEEKFAEVDERFDRTDKTLDQIEFFVSGQDRRLSVLEDRVRLLATKVGLDFRHS